MQFRITVDKPNLVDVSKLVPTQGELKFLSEENYLKLKHSIESYGFIEPINVWMNKGKYYIVNGHQRLTGVKRLIEEGVKIKQLPVTFIKAKTLEEARKSIVGLASQYGEFSIEGTKAYADSIKMNFEDFKRVAQFSGLNNISFQAMFEKKAEKEIVNSSKEIDIAGITRLQHECPKCGFEFNSGSK